MSWINIKNYNHYSDLEKIVPYLQQDILAWVQKHNIETDALSAYGTGDKAKTKISRLTTVPKQYVGELTEVPSNNLEFKHADDWKTIPCYYNRVWDKIVFPKSWEALSKLNGVYQILINFIKPHGKITPHKDTSNWDRIEEQLKRKVDGYSAVVTLFSGMKNKNEKTVGMDVEGIQKYPLAGEIVCFDGKEAGHSMWNDTNEWRITAVIDIDKKHFINERLKEIIINGNKETIILPKKPHPIIKLENDHYVTLKEPTIREINIIVDSENESIIYKHILSNVKYLTDNGGIKHYVDSVPDDELLFYWNNLGSKTINLLKQYFIEYKEYHNIMNYIELHAEEMIEDSKGE